jgi:acetyl-CoA hydrolase
MSESIDIASVLRPGDTIAWSGGTAEPVTLLAALNAQLERVPAGVSALIGLGLTETLDAARLAGRVRIRALGGAGTNRRFQPLGALDVLPCHYSALPDLVAGGTVRIDIALVQLAVGVSGPVLTGMIDHVADAIPRARTVIAEVNDQAPEVAGDTAVAAEDIDHVVKVSYPLLEQPIPTAGPIDRAIGEHVARLVPDGATLQVGLGALPDAILEWLATKKNLGLHSGTIGDGVVKLVDAGAITNRAKPIDTGLCVTAGLIGTSRLYRWAHRNRLLRLRSPRYTHEHLVLRQIPKLIGINTALEVDLTGQMNAEVAGTQHVGLIGGHADFMRGCLRSPGGRGIVALHSTARGGSASRIVAKLSSGIVTSSRADADIVVTEYGIADLRGRTVEERAAALTSIAHPDFRETLLAASERLM